MDALILLVNECINTLLKEYGIKQLDLSLYTDNNWVICVKPLQSFEGFKQITIWIEPNLN